ncbi:MAG: DUF547 domain-containing protein [Desulfobacterales bacterium]|nr:DUF547 domain-containing protein [Desulfobacterales bacterium]
MKTQSLFFFIALPLCLLFEFSGFTDIGRTVESVDNSLYAELLNKYVKDEGVDYAGFKREETVLDQYLEILEKTDTQNLTRDGQFAFYVNAYNAWTIKSVLSAYPGIKSIKELRTFLKSPWKKKICRLDGDTISLDTIEHDILRKRFKDPRVHFAINCASKSCPPLLSEPYAEDTLDQQLDDAAQAFINNIHNNYLEGDTLYVSMIFKWFSEDFNDDIIGLFLRYATGNLHTKLEIENSKIKIKYLDFDWSLNDK